MGKKLIIKGADFSANAIDEIVWTDISSSIVWNTVAKRQYIHYPNGNLNDAFQYNSGLDANLFLAIVDVHSYVGKRIKLHNTGNPAPSYYTGGAWFLCFASAVTSLPWTSTTNLQNAVTAVERIDGKGITSTIVDYILTVPVGATYLVFSSLNKGAVTLGVEL